MSAFSQIRIILAGPEQPRNIGSVLRIAANFGLNEVTVVLPKPLTEADLRDIHIASSGAAELINLHTSETLREALTDTDFVVGTSGRNRAGSIPVAESLSAIIPHQTETLALVFGRESTGLTSSELSLCDAQLRLPVSPKFPSMNLSHAVAVVLWEATRDPSSSSTRPNSPPQAECASRDLQERWLDQLDPDNDIRAQMRQLLRKSQPSTEDMAMLFNLVKECKRQRK